MQLQFLAFLILPILLGGAILVGLMVLTKIMPGEPGKGAQVAVPEPARGAEYVALTQKRKSAYRTGLIVLIGLAILSIAEYLSAALGSTVIMFLFIMFKAALVMYFFMHIVMVWRTEEAH
jgi:hypothetical protein